MMRLILLIVTAGALGACGRPFEVRSLASAALPVATNLKTSAGALQTRFTLQRTILDGRANELAQQAALARAQSNQVELDWKFAGEANLPKKMAMFREGDAAILADPLAAVAPAENISSTAPAFDQSSLDKLVTGLNRLRAARPPDGKELFAFVVSVNTKLGELNKEQDDAKKKAEDAAK